MIAYTPPVSAYRIDPEAIQFSDEDAALRKRNWRRDRWGYARRTILAVKKTRTSLYAHHEVCLRAFGRRPDWSLRETVDHINGNKMDNRRENLRIAHVSVNNRNRGRGKIKASNTEVQP